MPNGTVPLGTGIKSSIDSNAALESTSVKDDNKNDEEYERAKNGSQNEREVSEERKTKSQQDDQTQDFTGELEKERELSRSQQDTVAALSASLKGLEEENELLKRTQQELQDTVERLANENKKMKEVFSDGENMSDLLERMRIMEANSEIKDSNIEELKTKFSDLINYTSTLKTKCKALLETNEQLSNTVEQQERRLANDARGARNLELHFQESENNMNEQIAHFHEERDQMIANVKEYASNIERLRMEMLPFKEQEKRCVTIFRTGLILLDDLEEDKDLPMTNLMGFAKALVGKALKYKKDWQALHKNHANVQRSDLFRKQVTLNWRLQFEEKALLTKNLKMRIANLEEKVQQLGGEIGDPEEGFKVKD
ncbi:uncharacterized protein, partial [Watersipora subatra]|uniref:uncharacterized protein n=1 Tax=Watersipora subatra TaxID=2589382 RepID=UPI00355C446A